MNYLSTGAGFGPSTNITIYNQRVARTEDLNDKIWSSNAIKMDEYWQYWEAFTFKLCKENPTKMPVGSWYLTSIRSEMSSQKIAVVK